MKKLNKMTREEQILEGIFNQAKSTDVITKEQVLEAMRVFARHQVIEELEGILERSKGSAWYFEVIKRINELKEKL